MNQLLITLALVFISSQQSLLMAQPNGNMACINIKINKLLPKNSVLWLMLYQNSSNFPAPGEQSYSQQLLNINDTVKDTQICGLKSGWYAVRVFQDLDGDQEMNTNSLWQPKEPYGYSNNIRYKAIEPTFNQCKVFVEAGKLNNIVVNLITPD